LYRAKSMHVPMYVLVWAYVLIVNVVGLLLHVYTRRHRWTGRFEAHLWDKGTWNPTQKKKGRQGTQ